MKVGEFGIWFPKKSFDRFRKLAAKNGIAWNHQPKNHRDAMDMLLSALPLSLQESMLRYSDLRAKVDNNPDDESAQEELE